MTDYSWRKSSRSANTTSCVKLGWRKSSRSQNTTDCVEVHDTGQIRDSKNPGGPTLPVHLPTLIATIKADQPTR